MLANGGEIEASSDGADREQHRRESRKDRDWRRSRETQRGYDGADLALLGWSPKTFDAYNLLDVFPCGSAFNVARWCDPSYDALMRQAVRTLDDEARWRIERRLVEKLHEGVPAIPVYAPTDHFRLAPGVGGFSWSPMGFYELLGMTRS